MQKIDDSILNTVAYLIRDLIGEERALVFGNHFQFQSLFVYSVNGLIETDWYAKK